MSHTPPSSIGAAMSSSSLHYNSNNNSNNNNPNSSNRASEGGEYGSHGMHRHSNNHDDAAGDSFVTRRKTEGIGAPTTTGQQYSNAVHNTDETLPLSHHHNHNHSSSNNSVTSTTTPPIANGQRSLTPRMNGTTSNSNNNGIVPNGHSSSQHNYHPLHHRNGPLRNPYIHTHSHHHSNNIGTNGSTIPPSLADAHNHIHAIESILHPSAASSAVASSLHSRSLTRPHGTPTTTPNNNHHHQQQQQQPPQPPPQHPSVQQILREHQVERQQRSKRRRDALLTTAAIVASCVALLLCAGVLVVGLVKSQMDIGGTGNANDGGTGAGGNGGFNDGHPLFDEQDRYILHNYDAKPPFSDFLSGIAGVFGKPVWAFFVNRGQALASFGVRSKQYPILEFDAANTAYQNTPLLGFRTFIQGSRGKQKKNYFLTEPFSPQTTCYADEPDEGNGMALPSLGQSSTTAPSLPTRTMYIGQSEVQIQEVDHKHGIETNVTYFVLPDESYPALVRRTTVTNLRPEPLHLSFLDGLARMEPMGGEINNLLKNQGFSLQASMGVYRPYNNSLSYPFYRLLRGPEHFATDPGAQQAGHFCLSVLEDDEPSLLPIVFDTNRIFGHDTSLLNPVRLRSHTIQSIVESDKQYGFAKTSSAFAAVSDKTLEQGKSVSVASFYGTIPYMLGVPVIERRITMYGFVQFKQARSREVLKQMTSSVATRSSHYILDRHARQMLLDNVLRGGLPLMVGDVDDAAKLQNFDQDPRLKVVHLFGRSDGDLERDYNELELDPLFYSQGSAKFQEVIQNRRNDVILHPRTGSFTVKTFLSFIQADGYEPQVVESAVFQLKDYNLCNQLALEAVGPADGHRAQREGLRGILNSGPFRFGQVFRFIEENNVGLIISRSTFVDKVAAVATLHPVARFDEGFWPNHWVYYLDLLEAYLRVYPDGEQALLFEQDLPYFFSPAVVQPRRKKYVLFPPSYESGRGYHVKQVNATVLSKTKEAWMNDFRNGTTGLNVEVSWQHTPSGSMFRSTPIAKLLLLATLKFASRDPLCMGLEYEAGKAGWNDALEGLVWSLGSGVAETYELERLLRFLVTLLQKYQRPVEVPSELGDLLDVIAPALQRLVQYETAHPITIELNTSDVDDVGLFVPSGYLDYWNSVTEAREAYRAKVEVTFAGTERTLAPGTLISTLQGWIEHLKEGQARATAFGFQKYEKGEDTSSGETNEPKSTMSHTKSVPLNTSSTASSTSSAPSVRLPPTYFAFEVTEFYNTGSTTESGMPYVHAQALRARRFPLFLQGPVRKVKAAQSPSEAQKVYEAVKSSRLVDTKLHNMIKSSDSLRSQAEDLGKIMTYPPGWFDNESIWLDLSYKLYSQLLQHGLYDEFYKELTSGSMLPFMDPEEYGRPVIESSGFIVSSVFDDPASHGRGVLPRLNGASEFLGMWVLIMIGPTPFRVDPYGNLYLQLVPALPLWLFEERMVVAGTASGLLNATTTTTTTNTVQAVPPTATTTTASPKPTKELILSFNLFGQTNVTYYNRRRTDLYRVLPTRYEIGMLDGSIHVVDGPTIPSLLADKVRRTVFMNYINVFFE